MESGPRTILIAFAVPIVLCCGGGYFLLSSAVEGKGRKAREFGDQVVQAVTSAEGWDAAALRSMGTEQYQKTNSVSELSATVTSEAARTLGTYVSGVSSVKIIGTGDGKQTGTQVEYESRVKFTRGKARLKLQLELAAPGSSKWAVSSFNVTPY